MAERRKLTFSTVGDAIADIGRLRPGYERAGQWSLPQISFHVAFPIDQSLRQPKSLEPTPEQLRAHAFIEQVVASGWPNAKLDAPPPMVPPETAGDADVDQLIASLKRLGDYNASHVDAFFFGPLPAEKFRMFILAHAAHHLSFLQPTIQRRVGLRYADEAELKADLDRLRRGYAQTGNWSLPQVCWHLATATSASMRPGPFPPLTPEQLAARPKLEQLLKSGQLPGRINAPEQIVPPADCSDAEIDRLIQTVEKARQHPGPFAPHRVFGELSNDEARRLRLVHAAHHLSFLVPTQEES